MSWCRQRELEAGAASLLMGNCLWTRQQSIGSCPCTNTALRALLYFNICLSALPAVGWTCSECCRVNSFAVQIGFECCGEMGAEPFDVISNITSWWMLFHFNTWPALNGFRHELQPITDAAFGFSGPSYRMSHQLFNFVFLDFFSMINILSIFFFFYLLWVTRKQDK